MSNRRTRRNFTEEFKKQMVQLYLNGKPSSEIIKEYDLSPSCLPKWVICSCCRKMELRMCFSGSL